MSLRNPGTEPGRALSDFGCGIFTGVNSLIAAATLKTHTRSMHSFEEPDFPKLPGKLLEDLSRITPSVDGDLTYWPCAARLKDGTGLVCVYVVPELPYIRHWGVYPQQDRGKSYISVADVDALAESSRRLPARLANKLYKSGESGMGRTIFTVVFADGFPSSLRCRQRCRFYPLSR